MKKFREDAYPNPIDTKRHPSLAGLDNDLRREAMGLPVKRSEDDKQFLEEAGTWFDSENKRLESKRILKGLRPEQRMGLANRLLPNKMIPHHLQYKHMHSEEYEVEQRRYEKKWIQHNLQYK